MPKIKETQSLILSILIPIFFISGMSLWILKSYDFSNLYNSISTPNNSHNLKLN